MTPYGFFDIDGVLTQDRVLRSASSTSAMYADLAALHCELETLAEVLGLKTAAVSNMPAGQLAGLVHQLLPGVGVHWAESGAVMINMYSVQAHVYQPFREWKDVVRPIVHQWLCERGFTHFELGLMVNIIVVDPNLTGDRCPKRFRERLKLSFSELPERSREKLQLSFGDEGMLADLRPIGYTPHGWSKLNAYDQFERALGEIDYRHSFFVGDGDSDAELAKQLAAHGSFIIAPSNATKAMKAVAQASGGFLSRQSALKGTLEGIRQFSRLILARSRS